VAASGTLYRLAAFTTDPRGGNPAGVWVGEQLPDSPTMQSIAKAVGFSETAFVVPTTGSRRTIRYYSPEAEVAFCGHATIATGVVLGERDGDGTYDLDTAAGLVPVDVVSRDGHREASLTSVVPRYELASDALLDQVLSTLGWTRPELDSSIPPARAFAGAWHLVLAAASELRLATLSYDFAALKTLMLDDGLTTLQLVRRAGPTLFHARNPFPVGGVVEDPATGASAAALGGYLRDAGLIHPPHSFTILQGQAMGRPSRVNVHVPATGGIVVSGAAIHLDTTP
jgi:PhzF family phenazine biosynthesis protein